MRVNYVQGKLSCASMYLGLVWQFPLLPIPPGRSIILDTLARSSIPARKIAYISQYYPTPKRITQPEMDQ